MKTQEYIDMIEKPQFQVAEIVYGGVKTIISFTTLDAAKQYIGIHYTDVTDIIIIESVIKDIIVI